MSVALTALRTILAFFVLLLLARLMGKKLMSELTFFNFITGISVGTIAATIATDRRINLADGLTSLALWTALTVAMGYLSLRSIRIRKMVGGEPTVVIQNGKILENNMAKMSYNMHELMMQLRAEGVFDPSEAEFAVLEPTGKLSVLRKSQFQPVTPHDLNLRTGYKGMVSELIVDGDVIEQNLAQNGLTRQWLDEQLAAQGISNPKDVPLAALSPDGKLYVDERSDPGYKQRVED